MSTVHQSPPARTGRTTAAVAPLWIVAATATAVVVNLLVLWAGSAAGASLEIDAPYDLNAAAVAFSTAVPMLVGGALAFLLTRRYPDLRTWLALGGIAFALASAAMPFVVAADTATAVTLALMHVVVGSAWFAAITPRPGIR